jgi:tRNA (cytidine32/uridine32-2'-O)-methyltransferase
MQSKNIHIVLVGTSHPGNIGAVARAMKTMGLEQLRLVDPESFPHADATARASGADDVLAKVKVCATLAESVADCHLVVGASARLRSLAWPQLEPRACGERLVRESAQGPVALLFGRERNGLTNDELAYCHYLAHIPANPAYSSLNIAAAVQIFAYELRRASDATLPPAPEAEFPPATGAQMEGFFTHLEHTLDQVGAVKSGQTVTLMRRLRRLFQRARPDQNEVNILRGFLSAVNGECRD